MQPSQARFVTVCQQLLALGVVLAVLTPAAGVISLDVVPDRPSGSAAPAAVPMAAYARAATVPSKVPTEAVDARVQEYSLTAPAGARIAPGHLKARSVIQPSGASEVTSSPLPVTGYGAIGVTWQHGRSIADDAIAVQARTSDGTGWSGWTDVEYHDDHGPDPGSAEAVHSRPGTEPLLVGDVDEVQVRVATDAAAPSDMKLAVIDPGQAPDSARELPAIDTAELAGEDEVEPAAVDHRGRRRRAGAVRRDVHPEAEDLLARAVGCRRADGGTRGRCTTSRCTRASCTTPSTPTTTPARRCPASCAASTRTTPGPAAGATSATTSWSTGSAGSGRAGTAASTGPVVGAHTLGYNDNAFAMSAIGNFETAPSVAGDARGVRRAVRVEAVAARHQRRLHQAVGDLAQLQGDQRAPRRRLHGLPGQVPLRARSRRSASWRRSCRRAGAAVSSSPTSRAATIRT